MDVLEFVFSSHVCDAMPYLALVDQFVFTTWQSEEELQSEPWIQLHSPLKWYHTLALQYRNQGAPNKGEE